MANPTSNFNWQMPTPTDLVTDLPADFEVFGQAVDSSMADLLGGTTGQILAKNSNTNMDFVWITNDVGDITAVTAGTGISGGGSSGAVTITNSMATEIAAKGDLIAGTGSAAFDNLTAGANETRLVADSSTATGLKYVADTTNYAVASKGDLLAGTAADTLAPLTVGTNGQVLTADSAETTGLKWATPSGSTAVGCALYNTTNQTIAQATVTTVTFNSEVFDTDGFHSTATNTGRITIPTGKGGKYLFNLRVEYINSAATASVRQIFLNKNGSTDIGVYTVVAQNTTEIQCQIVSLTTAVAGDYFTLNTWQNSGGNTTLYNGIALTEFSCQYLGA